MRISVALVAIALFSAVPEATQAVGGISGGRLIFAYTGRACGQNAASVNIFAVPRPTGKQINVTEPISSKRSTLAASAGVYWISIRTQYCMAEGVVPVFADTDRVVPVMLQSIKHGESEDEGGGRADVFLVVTSDFVMVDLPVDGLSVSATINNGVRLEPSVQGRKAFLDNIPAGILKISVSGANFTETKEVTSFGNAQLHVVRF